jgi:hypothetical protein
VTETGAGPWLLTYHTPGAWTMEHHRTYKSARRRLEAIRATDPNAAPLNIGRDL